MRCNRLSVNLRSIVDSNQEIAGSDSNVRNSFHEIIDSASVRIATFDIVLLPFDVIDLAGNVSANDVIFFNLIEGQMWVVDTDENHTGVIGFVDEYFVINFRDRDLSGGPVDIQVNVL